jgi:hypothetical protein
MNTQAADVQYLADMVPQFQAVAQKKKEKKKAEDRVREKKALEQARVRRAHEAEIVAGINNILRVISSEPFKEIYAQAVIDVEKGIMLDKFGNCEIAVGEDMLYVEVSDQDGVRSYHAATEEKLKQDELDDTLCDAEVLADYLLHDRCQEAIDYLILMSGNARLKASIEKAVSKLFASFKARKYIG